MRTLRLDTTNISMVLEEAVAVLQAGGILAYPTETFYALGARFDNEAALERIFALKGRPSGKPLSLIISSAEMLSLVARSVPDIARPLMKRFWPGPVTIAFPSKDGLSRHVTSRGRVAVRVPGESFSLSLVRSAEFPVTATSANLSGAPPASDAEAVRNMFPEGMDLLVDGGKAPGGLPSTVLDVSRGGVDILRHGAAIIEPNDFGTA
jgi:L-threonylcarbamoyladenylate synthase